MSASTTAKTSSTSVYTTPLFWERLWRQSGIHFVVFFIIAYVIYGYQPGVGASADALVAFYDGDRTRILIAAAVSGMAVSIDTFVEWRPSRAFAHHFPLCAPPSTCSTSPVTWLASVK